MSGEMHDRLKKLICRLKESTARGEAATSAAEEKVFRDLAFVYDHDLRNAAQNDLGVAIEQYNDLRRPERFIQFKRVTAVYERDMYNKFFVPIWAVAMNADKSVGYVLSPKLTPLREVLKDLKESYQTSDDYYDKLNQVLRLCVAPIALAIDALHTPIFNKRMMYHHRDICIDNIYMRVRKGIDSSGQENVEHDDARLKLTNLAREAHVLPNEADGLPSLTEYYHHADVKYDREPYDRKHDWYSFGVYILEVLHLTLPVTIQTGFRQIQDYIDVIHIYDSWIQSPLKKDAIRSFVLRYLDIAFKCLKLEPNELQPLNYEIPDEMKQRFLEPSQTFQMYFEYSVSTWTAELLWMYEESRPKETPDGSVAEVCQACLLHPTETISTNQHGRGNQPKCDENCQYHCLFCYTNEERLFCSRQHGTTGTYVDHRYSYALILYSQSFEEMCKKDTESAGINLFKEEADMLAKALKSKYICGLLEGNIHVRPVYGNGTSEDCLKRHCEEMRKLIHGDGKSLCSNDTSYTLFVLYFGHSYHGCDKTVGDWCPSFTHTSDDTFEPLRLKRALVHYHMTSIQKCTNYGTGQPECQAACLGVNYLVNPCGPSPGSTAHQWSADKDVSISERSQPLVVTGAATCGITDWFCQMLQGLYHRDCSGKPHLQDIQKRENYHSKCKVPLGKIDVCFKLARYIYEELGDALIDGECLRIHQKHLKTHNGYTELMVQIDDEHCKPVLAYYKPQGVFRKVFSANEGEEQVRIDMGSETTCEKIKNTLLNQIKQREQYRDKTLNIVLRGSSQLEHPIVSDDNIRDILESSELFYHAIPSDKQVTIAESQSTIGMECGFCFQKQESMVKPRVLECKHVHCLPCLTEYYEKMDVLLCPVPGCREGFVGSAADLPTYNTGKADIDLCQVCVVKNRTTRKAVTYCCYCKMTYCNKHEQSHDDIFGEHARMSMEEYKADATKLQKKECVKHKKPFVLACKLCLTIACDKCVPELITCDNGKPHKWEMIDKLVPILRDEGIFSEIMEKEVEYEEVFKEHSKYIVDFDNDTEQQIKKLYRERDAEIEAINTHYAEQIAERTQRRHELREEEREFLEDKALKNWTQLRARRQLFELRVKRANKVDVVQRHQMWKEETQNFIKQLPELASPLKQQLGANSVDTKGPSESNKKDTSANDKFIFNDLPDPASASPDNKQGSPDNKQDSPDNKQGTPDNKQVSPDNKQVSPDNKQGSPDKKQRLPDKKRRSSDGKLGTPEHRLPVYQEDGGDFDREEELVAVERLTRQQSADRQRNARIPAEVLPRPPPQPGQPLKNVWNCKLIAFTCLVVLLANSLYWFTTVERFRVKPDSPAGDRSVAEEEFPCKISDKPAEDIENFCNRITSDKQFCRRIKSNVEAIVDKHSKCILYYRPWLNHKREAQEFFNRIECALTGHNQILPISGSEMEGEGHHTELHTKLSEWLDSDRKVAVIYDVERLNKESGLVIRRVCDAIHTEHPGKYLVLLTNYKEEKDVPEDHWLYVMIERFVAEEEFQCKISDRRVDIGNFCNKLASDRRFCEDIKSHVEALVDRRSKCILHYRPWLNHKREIAQNLFNRLECALTGHNHILSISGSEMEGEGHRTELYTKMSEWFASDSRVAVIYDVERLNKESGQVIRRVRDEIRTKYPGRYLVLLTNYNKRRDIPENHWIYEMIKRYAAEEEFPCKISDKPAEDIEHFCNILFSDNWFCEGIKSNVEAIVDKRSMYVLHFNSLLNNYREIAQKLFNSIECALTGHKQILPISGIT